MVDKQEIFSILKKKKHDQRGTPTFFDNLIYYKGLKEENETILSLWEQLLNSKSNRFSSYKNRIKNGFQRTISEDVFALSQGTHSLIKWKDLDVYKTAYDFVIYWMLISELKPNTIIEYGSGSGGSALWLADISLAIGLDTDIISYDINVPNVTHPKVQFVEIDFTQDFEIEVDRPGKKLVIEDTHVNVKEILLKTDLYLKKGDYLVVEDSIDQLPEISKFLSNTKNTYKIDNFYLDFFGRNVTCCVDSIFKVF